MRLLLILGAAVSTAAALAPSTNAGASGCPKDGVKYYSGGVSQTIIYCGPAKVSLSIGGKTIFISQGRCTVLSQKFLQVNIGISSLRPKQGWKYFGLVAMGTKDGIYGSTAKNFADLRLLLGGYHYEVLRSFRVTVSSHHTKGSFSGVFSSLESPETESGVSVRGQFTCNGNGV